jgi:heme A synthase
MQVADARSITALRRAGRVAFIAALLTVGLMTYGGWVRASGSGLGCPDWPLCQGVFIPDLEGTTAIEFGHRLYAGVTMIAVAIATILGYQARRVDPVTFRLLLIAFGAILLQAGLGGITVLTELHGGAVVAHLALAMTTLALLSAGALHAIRPGAGPSPGVAAPTLLLGLGAVVVLLGSGIVGTGYSAACSGLPFCDDHTGALGPVLLHTAHRLITVILMVALLAMTVWLSRQGSGRLFVTLNHSVSLAMAVQIAVGLMSVSFIFPEGLRVLHLGLATLIWWGLASIWALALQARRA